MSNVQLAVSLSLCYVQDLCHQHSQASALAARFAQALLLATIEAAAFHLLVCTLTCVGEANFHTLERRWYRPTLEVVGMWGGFTGVSAAWMWLRVQRQPGYAA